MTGAMYAAISGLKVHMNKLNVIGNNVANVNTYGYKSGRATFEEAMYTTSRSGSNGTSYVGGHNPSQIGYGAELRSIDLKMTSGNYAPTGYPGDCMIDGDGFFLVGDKTLTIDPDDPESVKQLTLTRVGDLDFRSDGYLCDARGNVVYGFLCSKGENADLDGNLVREPTTSLVPIRLPLVDTNGKACYPTVGTDGKMDFPEAGETVDGSTPEAKVTENHITVDTLQIDEETGKITCVTKDSEEIVTVGYLALGVPANPAGVSHTGGPYYKALDGAGTLSIASLGGAVEGYIGKGDDATTGIKIITSGGTKLRGNGLELSNADLATEITEMITAQRGYQANTRIITVTDAMLEELVNIKR